MRSEDVCKTNTLELSVGFIQRRTVLRSLTQWWAGKALLVTLYEKGFVDQAKLDHVFTMASDNLIFCRSDFQSSNSVNWWSNLPSPYFRNIGLWGPSLTETLLPSTAMWPGKVWAPLSLQGVLRGRVQVGEDEKACSSLASPEYQPLPLTHFVSNVSGDFFLLIQNKHDIIQSLLRSPGGPPVPSV